MSKYVVDVDVFDVEKRRMPSKHYNDLLDKFPVEGGCADPQFRIIPFLPGKILFGRSHIRDVALKRLKEINLYCKTLLSLPPHVSQSESVLQFFEMEAEDVEPPSTDLQPRKVGKHNKAGEITALMRLERFKAVADYVPEEDGALCLKAGMIAGVIKKSDGGTEEQYICIEKFQAENADEISLDKGVCVTVTRKNADGWWNVRYRGNEGLAPVTYLQKGNGHYAKHTMDKNYASGVKMASDILSNLANTSSSESSIKVVERPGMPFVERSYAKSDRDYINAGRLQSLDDKCSGKNWPVERYSSLKPSPWRSCTNESSLLTANTAGSKTSSTYLTIADFEDTVGDGMSFKAGETVIVLEKTSSGWWFVERGEDQGWVSESYLEELAGSITPSQVMQVDGSPNRAAPLDVSVLEDEQLQTIPWPKNDVMELYRAVADFCAEGPGEISLQCGEVVTVLERRSDWWLVTRSVNDKEGWVPANFLQPL